MSDCGHCCALGSLHHWTSPSSEASIIRPQPRKAQQVLLDCSSTIRMRASSALMLPCVPHSPAWAPSLASASGPAAASIDATTLSFATSACTKPTPQTVSLPLQQKVRAVADPPQLFTAEELARLWCEEVLVEGLARERRRRYSSRREQCSPPSKLRLPYLPTAAAAANAAVEVATAAGTAAVTVMAEAMSCGAMSCRRSPRAGASDSDSLSCMV